MNERLARPDAALAHRGPEIGAHIKPRSVGWVVGDTAGGAIRRHAAGSAVPVRIHDRSFLLSAGHCIKEILAGPSDSLRLAVGVEQRGCVRAKVGKNKLCFQESCDFGYIEIAPLDAATLESSGYVFSSFKSITCLSSQDVAVRPDDWFILAGFPAALREQSAHGDALQFFHACTKLSYAENAPHPLPPPAVGVTVFDLWMPPGAVNYLSGAFERFAMPPLSGASGGGCWKANLYPDPDSWTAKRTRLCGIHIGTIPGHEHFFARSVSVAHHLRMIADDYPDLREFIFTTWPLVKVIPTHNAIP
jgi:hypothetical protein